MQPISNIYPQLHSQKQVVITMHQKPDGDAMGSSLALFHCLEQFGHQVTEISPTNGSSFLNFQYGKSYKKNGNEFAGNKSGADTD